MADFTKILHKKPYAAIDPTQPALSQTGRTLLITGGGTGIGFAISRAFVAAGISRLILVARRRTVLEEAREALLKTASEGKKPDILIEELDIGNETHADRLWNSLDSRGIEVDCLCLNAVVANMSISLWKDEKDLWNLFEANVHGNLRIIKGFLNQGPSKGKVIINVSTLAAHMNPAIPGQGSYSATKMAFTATLQWLADELKPEETRVFSYHPGAIYTPAAQSAGFAEDAIDWDHEDLPAHFAVWLASPEAEFLHSRFLWAHWDVNELKAMRNQIETHSGWLRMGLQGPNPVNGVEYLSTFLKAPPS